MLSDGNLKKSTTSQKCSLEAAFANLSDPVCQAVGLFKKDFPDLNGFCNRMTDRYVHPEMQPYVYITGGITANFLNKNTFAGDLDFWFNSVPPKDVIRKQYKFAKNVLVLTSQVDPTYDAMDQLNGRLEGGKKRSALTYFDQDNQIAVQFILRFIMDPIENVTRFDYQHVQPWFDCASRQLNITNEQIYAIYFKNLIPTDQISSFSEQFIKQKLTSSLYKKSEEYQTYFKRYEKWTKRGYSFGGIKELELQDSDNIPF